MSETQDALFTQKKVTFLAVIILGLVATFYLYEFILQVSPAVMTSELMKSLNMDAAGLGLMSAFYYYGYTPMQLPAGLLFDRYGTRTLLTIAVAVCAIGALMFSMADTFLPVAFGRFFMGVGSAFAFIGALVVLTRWFPPQYFAVLAGLIQLMSSAGAIAGEAPLAAAVQHYGWRHTIFVLAIVGFVIALSIWLVVRDSPVRQQRKLEGRKSLSEFKRLKIIFSDSQTWWVGIYAFCSWAPVLVFSALWGVPFLMQSYGISTTQAASMCSMVWVGIGLGSPFIGVWSEIVKKRCFPLFISALIGLISISAVLYVKDLPIGLAYVALFFLGLSASGQALSFALVRDNNRPETVGTAIGFNNMLVVSGGLFFQPLVGIILQAMWKGNVVNGVPVYLHSHYQLAMTIIPVCFIAGMILSTKVLRESHCQPRFVHQH